MQDLEDFWFENHSLIVDILETQKVSLKASKIKPINQFSKSLQIEDLKDFHSEVLYAPFLENLKNMHSILMKHIKTNKDKKAYVMKEDGIRTQVDAKALFYLEHLIQLLEEGNDQYVQNGSFGNYVIQNQVVEPNGTYDVEKIQNSLRIIQQEADSKIYEAALHKQKKNKANKERAKKKKMQESIQANTVMIQQPIEFITKVEEFKEILHEFPQVEKIESEEEKPKVQSITLEKIKVLEEQKEQKNDQNSFFKIDDKPQDDLIEDGVNSQNDSYNNSNQEIDLDEDDLGKSETTMSCSDTHTISSEHKTISTVKETIISFLTVHSRAKDQLENTHWQDRLNERGNYDLSDENLKSEVLQELKQIMLKHPDNIQKSQKCDDRFLVTGKGGLHFVLQKLRARRNQQKDVYVPVTVLAPNMKF